MATPVQGPPQNPAMASLLAKIKASQGGGRPNVPGMVPSMPTNRPPMGPGGPPMPPSGPQMGPGGPPGMPNIPPEILAKLMQMKAGGGGLMPETPPLPDIPENITSTLTIDDLIRLLMESAKQEQAPVAPPMPPRVNPMPPPRVMPPGPQNIAPMAGPTNPLPQPNPMNLRPGGM